MSETKFIVREPLLSPKEKLLGYKITWQSDGEGGNKLSTATMAARIGVVSEQLTDAKAGWLLGENQIFLEATPELLTTQVLGQLPPKNTVLSIGLADLAQTETLLAVKALRDLGFGIMLRDADLETQDRGLLSLVSHVEVHFGASDFRNQAKMYGSLKQSSICMVARKVGSWQEFDSCASLGLDVFAGEFYLTTRPGAQAKGLNPAQVMILQLMEMVRKNADVRQLEGILRRDADLSYKLLRYINSAGFGLGAEIQSLRHAVTMLGYSPLYRWLSLLLATASQTGQSPILMQAAVVRGRFAELLGRGLLPKNEAENLFVSGMFSLLDRLLRIPMEKLLDNLQLPEPVTQALLTREGIYGPFLALAEACEHGDGQVGDLADSLFIGAREVNEAHLSALAWAQNLKL